MIFNNAEYKKNITLLLYILTSNLKKSANTNNKNYEIPRDKWIKKM